MTCSASPTHSSYLRFAASLAWLLVPGILFFSIALFSPNFSPNFLPDDPAAGQPPGGDFLQEYTGGRMLQDPLLRERLYDQQAFRSVQHDPRQLGFSWQRDKYFPAVYPPFWYMAIQPLARLDYLPAARCWLALMTLALAAALLMLYRTEQIPGWMAAVLCCAPPVVASLASGQKGTLLLLILTTAWVLLRAGKPLGSGLVFGLIGFKPHLGLPIGLLMLAGRQWRWVSGVWLTLSGLILVSCTGGMAVCRGFISMLTGLGNYLETGGYRLAEGFSLAAACHLTSGNPQAATMAAGSLSAVLALATIWYLRNTRFSCRRELARATAAAVVLMILVVPHFYWYDLVVLVLPVCLLVRLAGEHGWGRAWVMPAGLLTLLLFGSGALVRLTAASGFPWGVLLLVVALGMVLKLPLPSAATRDPQIDRAAALPLRYWQRPPGVC